MSIRIRRVGDGPEVVCSTPLTGSALLSALGLDVAILANIQPLKDGQPHRTFRRVTLEDECQLLDLSTYSEVYTTDRCFLGRIEAVPLPHPHMAVAQGTADHSFGSYDPKDSITVTQHRAFEHAYQWLSTHVFAPVLGYPLRPCLITLQRRHHTYGYFCRDQFAYRPDRRTRTDEIALNPDLFPGRSDQEVLSTLAHEAVHSYQRWYGKPGRRGYHNKEWALTMERIGLMPSHTGQPGGRKTGEQMTHYILAGGAFAAAITALLATGFCVPWQSGLPDPLPVPGGNAPAPVPRRRKTTFTCAHCQQRAWAKPTASLVCGTCKVPMYASIL